MLATPNKLAYPLFLGIATMPVLLAADPALPATTAGVMAMPAAITGKLEGKLLAAGDSRIMILNADGSIAWEHRTSLTHDVWMLANANLLYADGGSVTEITPDKTAVWSFTSPTTARTMMAVQKLTAAGKPMPGKLLR
jgi:hypothetical protein